MERSNLARAVGEKFILFHSKCLLLGVFYGLKEISCCPQLRRFLKAVGGLLKITNVLANKIRKTGAYHHKFRDFKPIY